MLLPIPSRRVLLAAALAAGALTPSLAADAEAPQPAVPAVSSAAPAPAIRVVAATRQPIVETLSVNGTIVARQEAAVGSDLSGLAVVALNADIGDRVRKGDVLAVLDRSALDTQLAQQTAARAQAAAGLEQTKAQIADAEVGVRQATEALQRTQALKAKGVTTQAELDNARNAVDSAKAKLNAATRAVDASQAQLGVIDAQTDAVKVQVAKTELRAPADGLVLSRDATLGGVVAAGGAPLFRIAIDGEFELAANVAETVLPRLEVGMPAQVAVGGADAPIPGKVRLISPEVDQASRLGAIRVSLAPGQVARAGNFARGEIELVRREGLAVPTSALIYRGADAFLQRVDAGTVKTVPVKLGARAGRIAEIVSGLSAGEEVVSRAGTFVADGDKVTPVRDETTGAVQP